MHSRLRAQAPRNPEPSIAGTPIFKRFASGLLLACMAALTSWACAPKTAGGGPGPGVDGYDDSRLQALVEAGLDAMVPGPCNKAMLLGVLDDDAAGLELARMQERALGSNLEGACSELIAAARLMRLGRLGELDLAAELKNPVPIARAVALRYAFGSQPAAVTRALVSAAVADADVDVRIVAYRVAAALADPELITALTEATPEDENEAFWRCAALKRLQPSVNCTDPSTRQIVAVGDAEPADRCERARTDLAEGRRRDALWFYLASAFRHRAEPLDRVESTRLELPPCLLDEAAEDTILSTRATPIEEQAIAAAALLWRRHEAVGMLRQKRVQLRELAQDDMLRACSSPQDCPNHHDCVRAPGRGHGGVCGTSRSRDVRRRPSVYVTTGSNACWSFMDCPAFFSCYYPDPRWGYGVCMY